MNDKIKMIGSLVAIGFSCYMLGIFTPKVMEIIETVKQKKN